MTITAKYPATCGSCGQRINVGTKIEWAKGAPVRHSTCTSGRTSGRAARHTGGRHTGCRCGSVEDVMRASDCWTCRHDAE